MTGMLEKAVRIWREEGLTTLATRSVRFGYDTWIRSSLPRRVVSYNGVPVRASRLGDSLVPWQTRNIPGYESALVNGIRQYVETGDTVVVVGGGWGVSTVVAANRAGVDGNVVTFEGGAKSVVNVTDAVQLNDVADRVSVRHAVVGRAISLRGQGDDAQVVPPTELPDCDVLVLDCEGAELDILEEMEIHPRSVLVETHGMFGASRSIVETKLKKSQFEINECSVAEKRVAEFCKENDIYVISASRASA